MAESKKEAKVETKKPAPAPKPAPKKADNGEWKDKGFSSAEAYQRYINKFQEG